MYPVRKDINIMSEGELAKEALTNAPQIVAVVIVMCYALIQIVKIVTSTKCNCPAKKESKDE